MYTSALLDPSRFTVVVISGPQTGSEGSLIEEVRQRGVDLTILPELLREISPVNDLKAFYKLYRQIRKGKYVIVHTHSSKAGILGRIAAKLAGAPIIIHTVHGWSFHDHMSPLVKNTYIFLERLTARFTAKLIVVAGKDIQKGLQNKIGKAEQYRLIRSSIPLDEFDPSRYDGLAIRKELGIPEGVPVLGSLGRFSAQKNPLDWVRVAGQVGRSLPNCRFLLVGDGPLRQQVIDALKAEGVYYRTILTGLRRDPARMFSAMDVFLLTSLWEGLPRVIPQAMAMRIPPVAYRVDGTEESIMNGQTGFLADPGDIQGMVGCCIRLLQDPALLQKIGDAGHLFATQEFDITHMIHQIEDLYSQLLDNLNQGKSL